MPGTRRVHRPHTAPSHKRVKGENKFDASLPSQISNMRTGSILPSNKRINVKNGTTNLVPTITKAIAPGFDSFRRDVNKFYDMSQQPVTAIPSKKKLSLAGIAASGKALQNMSDVFSLADAQLAGNQPLAELVMRRSLTSKEISSNPVYGERKKALGKKLFDIEISKEAAEQKKRKQIFNAGDELRKLPTYLVGPAYQLLHGHLHPSISENVAHGVNNDRINRRQDAERDMTDMLYDIESFDHNASSSNSRSARMARRVNNDRIRRRQDEERDITDMLYDPERFDHNTSSSLSRSNKAESSRSDTSSALSPGYESAEEYTSFPASSPAPASSSSSSSAAAAAAPAKPDVIYLNPANFVGMSPSEIEDYLQVLRDGGYTVTKTPSKHKGRYYTATHLGSPSTSSSSSSGQGLRRKKGRGKPKRFSVINGKPSLTRIPNRRVKKTYSYDTDQAYTRAKTIMGSLDSGNNSKTAKNQLADLLRYLYLCRAMSKNTYWDALKQYVADV